MLAARAYPGQDSLVLEEIDRPDAGPGEVIVRVRAAGLAPGLFHVLKHGLIPLLPAPVGHEIAGDVVELGDGVSELEVGQRVRVHPTLTCRSCDYCLTDRDQMCSASAMIGHAVFGPDAMPLYKRYHAGGLAEFVRVPAWLVDPLPANVGYDVGSKVHDLANALRALKLADLRPGATLVVTAATGAMGMATIRLAPLFGVRRVLAVGRSSDRLESVRQTAPSLIDVVGLDRLDSTWGESGGLTAAVRQAIPQGADAAIDFLPEGPGSAQVVAALRNGGTLVHMGGNQASVGGFAPLLFACHRIVGTRNCSRTDAHEVLAMLGSGVVSADDLITHRYRLSDVNNAVESLLARSEPIWMATVHP